MPLQRTDHELVLSPDLLLETRLQDKRAEVKLQKDWSKLEQRKLLREELLHVLNVVESSVDEVNDSVKQKESLVIERFSQENAQIKQLLLQLAVSQNKATQILESLSSSEGDHYLPEDVDQIWAEIEPYLNKVQLDYVRTIQTSNDLESVKSALLALSLSIDSTSTQWNLIVKSGEFPPQILDSILPSGENVSYFDQINFWIKLQKVLEIVESHLKTNQGLNKEEQRLVRAQALKSLLAADHSYVGPALLYDLIDGKINSNDELFENNLIDIFGELNEGWEKHQKNLSPLQKKLITVLLATVLGVTVSLAGGDSLQKQVRGLFTEETHTYQNDNDTEVLDQESESQDVESIDENQDQDSPPTIQDRVNPENSGEFPEGNVWEIEGDVPEGYFRTDTASSFYSNPTWDMDRTGNWENVFLSDDLGFSTTILNSSFEVSSTGYYPLAMPTGYRPTAISLENGTAGIRVFRKLNDTYVVALSEVEDSVQIRVGIENVGDVVSDQPTEESLETAALIGDPSTLPSELQNILEEVSNESINLRATHIADFIRNYFTYSIDPRFSDLHRLDTGRGVFLRLIFQFPYGDCDVVNTALVASLRQSGIPARMVYGYMNQNSLFDDGERYLAKAEGHGWVEYWDGEKWNTLDATPTRVDEYTKSRLEDLNGGTGISEVISLNFLKEFLKSLPYLLLNLGEGYLNYGLLPSIILYLLAQGIIEKNKQAQLGRFINLANELFGSNSRDSLSIDEIDQIKQIGNKSIFGQTGRKLDSFRSVLKRLAVFPMIPESLRRNKSINNVEIGLDTLSDSEEAVFEKHDLKPFLKNLFEITDAEFIRQTAEYNFDLLTHKLLRQFYDVLRRNEDKETRFFLVGLSSNQFKILIFSLLSKSANEGEFLELMMNQSYKIYLNERKRGNKGIRSYRRRKKLEKALEYQEFASRVAPAFVYLSYMWDFYQKSKVVTQTELEKVTNSVN